MASVTTAASIAAEVTVTSHRRKHLSGGALVLVIAAATGCDRPRGTANSAAGSGDEPARLAQPQVVAAWTRAGLTVSAFTKDHSGAIGDNCQSGTVSGIDVAICTFPAEQDAKAAESKGLAWVGEATGASLANGLFMLAAVDRRNADPSGRTINQIIKLFRDPANK